MNNAAYRLNGSFNLLTSIGVYVYILFSFFMTDVKDFGNLVSEKVQ